MGQIPTIFKKSPEPELPRFPISPHHKLSEKPSERFSKKPSESPSKKASRWLFRNPFKRHPSSDESSSEGNIEISPTSERPFKPPSTPTEPGVLKSAFATRSNIPYKVTFIKPGPESIHYPEPYVSPPTSPRKVRHQYYDDDDEYRFSRQTETMNAPSGLVFIDYYKTGPSGAPTSHKGIRYRRYDDDDEYGGTFRAPNSSKGGYGKAGPSGTRTSKGTRYHGIDDFDYAGPSGVSSSSKGHAYADYDKPGPSGIKTTPKGRYHDFRDDPYDEDYSDVEYYTDKYPTQAPEPVVVKKTSHKKKAGKHETRTRPDKAYQTRPETSHRTLPEIPKTTRRLLPEVPQTDYHTQSPSAYRTPSDTAYHARPRTTRRLLPQIPENVARTRTGTAEHTRSESAERSRTESSRSPRRGTDDRMSSHYRDVVPPAPFDYDESRNNASRRSPSKRHRRSFRDDPGAVVFERQMDGEGRRTEGTVRVYYGTQMSPARSSHDEQRHDGHTHSSRSPYAEQRHGRHASSSRSSNAEHRRGEEASSSRSSDVQEQSVEPAPRPFWDDEVFLGPCKCTSMGDMYYKKLKRPIRLSELPFLTDDMYIGSRSTAIRKESPVDVNPTHPRDKKEEASTSAQPSERKEIISAEVHEVHENVICEDSNSEMEEIRMANMQTAVEIHSADVADANVAEDISTSNVNEPADSGEGEGRKVTVYTDSPYRHKPLLVRPQRVSLRMDGSGEDISQFEILKKYECEFEWETDDSSSGLSFDDLGMRGHGIIMRTILTHLRRAVRNLFCGKSKAGKKEKLKRAKIRLVK